MIKQQIKGIMENETIAIKCPECGKILKVKKPAKPGTYQVVCHACGHAIKIQLRPQPIKLE